jgi:hypothetical protein
MFISPIWALILSIKKLDWHHRKWILILFITVYGSLIQNPIGGDIVKYLPFIRDHYMDLSFNQFIKELYHIIILKPLPTTNDDVYLHLVGFFVGGVLRFPALLPAITSFVFAYFYINALSKILIYERRYNKPLVFSALVILLIIYRGIDTMQTIRNATAIWVLFDGALGYFLTKKRKFILQILISPLIHFSFIALILPTLSVIILRHLNSRIFVAFYVLSFFISIPSTGIISQIEQIELGEDKLQSYDYYTDEVPDNNPLDIKDARWYLRYGKGKIFYLGSHALAFTLIISGIYRKRMTKTEDALFTIGLLTATMANFGDFIPVFYSRCMYLAGLFIVATTTMLVIRGELLKPGGFSLELRKLMIYISLLIFVPKYIYTLANLLYYTSVFVLGFPIIGWFAGENNIVIRKFIDLLL